MQSWAGNHPLFIQLLDLLYACDLPVVLKFFLLLEIYFVSFLEVFFVLAFCHTL